MQVYLVGGAVRDLLLGQEIKDRDWVVVGATPADMLALGFQTVGNDFPVFLHPQSHEEYALARTERKTQPGYHGFQFNTDSHVTLEQDLSRRDLTINAMAQDAAGNIIDPHHGQQDLQDAVLRHIGPAFQEDPVRLLRVARFAARYDFSVATETLALMRGMTSNGEVDALVPERVWQELARALLEPHPQRFFEVLDDCGALARLLPELVHLKHHHPQTWQQSMALLQNSNQQQPALISSYALLCVYLSPPLTPLHQRLRVPKECIDAANILQDAYPLLLQHQLPSADKMLHVFQSCDVWRRPQRFALLWQHCQLMARLPQQPTPHPVWLHALAACQRLDNAAIARQCTDGRQIAATINQARLATITACLASHAVC